MSYHVALVKANTGWWSVSGCVVAGQWCVFQYRKTRVVMWWVHANAKTTMRCHHW